MNRYTYKLYTFYLSLSQAPPICNSKNIYKVYLYTIQHRGTVDLIYFQNYMGGGGAYAHYIKRNISGGMLNNIHAISQLNILPAIRLGQVGFNVTYVNRLKRLVLLGHISVKAEIREGGWCQDISLLLFCFGKL